MSTAPAHRPYDATPGRHARTRPCHTSQPLFRWRTATARDLRSRIADVASDLGVTDLRVLVKGRCARWRRAGRRASPAADDRRHASSSRARYFALLTLNGEGAQRSSGAEE